MSFLDTAFSRFCSFITIWQHCNLVELLSIFHHSVRNKGISLYSSLDSTNRCDLLFIEPLAEYIFSNVLFEYSWHSFLALFLYCILSCLNHTIIWYKLADSAPSQSHILKTCGLTHLIFALFHLVHGSCFSKSIFQLNVVLPSIHGTLEVFAASVWYAIISKPTWKNLTFFLAREVTVDLRSYRLSTKLV